jgi:predicted amidohydrolase YtcJ
VCINCGFTQALGSFLTGAGSVPRISRRRFVGNALVCAAAGGVEPTIAVSAQTNAVVPDSASSVSVIFRSGKSYTVDDTKSWAQAVAIAGDRIVAVGSDVENIHPFMGSFMTSGVDLQVPTAQAALAAIELYAKAHPAGPIRGFGWRVDMFPSEGPTRQVLDAVLPNRPAFFFSIDGHSLWANSKALEIAGVGADTPDPIPDFSYFTRDKAGPATG